MNDRRQFRLLALGSWVSQFGNGVTALTVLLALTRWSENAAWLISCYAAAGIAPRIVFGVVSGTLADRFDRRRLMITADIVRAGLVALLVLAGPDRLWLVVAVGFAVSWVGTVSVPAASALLPAVVGVEGVAQAQATLVAGANVARVAGLGLAGTLAAGGSMRAGFVVDAATFLVAAGLKLRLRVHPRPGAAQEVPFVRQLTDGLAVLRRSRPFAVVVFVQATAAMAGSAIHVLWVPFTLDTLGATPVWLAILEGAGVIGLVGAGAVLRRRSGTADGWIFAGMALTGFCLAGFAAATHVAALLPLEVLFGVGIVLISTGTQRVLTRTLGEDLLGRAFGTLGAATESCTVVALMAFGFAADVAPARLLFVAAGVVLLAGAAFGARALPHRPAARSVPVACT